MNLASSIKKAPRWAWVTAAGVGIGAGAIKVYNGRAKGKAAAATATEVADPTTGLPFPTTTGNPIATIVPPVILQGSNSDPNVGVGALQELFVGGVQGLISSYEGLVGPLMTTQTALLLGNAQTIQDLAIAGSAPNSTPQTQPLQITLPDSLVSYSPPAPATPLPLPAGPAPAAFKTEYKNVNRNNGKAGAARRAWCVKQTIHRYPDGRAVVVSEDKIKDGSC